MTEILHLEPTTITDFTQILSPKHKHTKLARSAAEFLFEACARPNDYQLPDLETLRNFVDHLITKQGYN